MCINPCLKNFNWFFLYLLQGADPNCINNNDVPVLHIAVKNKHIDAIPILVQEGADVNVKGSEWVLGLGIIQWLQLD